MVTGLSRQKSGGFNSRISRLRGYRTMASPSDFQSGHRGSTPRSRILYDCFRFFYGTICSNVGRVRFGRVTQLVEWHPDKVLVDGSSPSLSTCFRGHPVDEVTLKYGGMLRVRSPCAPLE